MLGISGDPSGRAAALSAGADGFLESGRGPARLPDRDPAAPDDRPASLSGEAEVEPDPLALHDDLARAARSLGSANDPAARRLPCGLPVGAGAADPRHRPVGRHRRPGRSGGRLDALSRLLQDRLSQGDPFRPAPAER